MAKDDKTEAPTPKRKREARKEGRIPKSPELATWGALLLASFVLPMALGGAARQVSTLLHESTDLMAHPDPAAALGLVSLGARTVLTAVLPIAAAMMVFGVGVNVAQTGLVLSATKLKPKGERINPMKGFKRMVSAEMAWNTVKVLLRTGMLALAAYVPLRATAERFTTLNRAPLVSLIGDAGHAALVMVRLVAAVGLLLGLLDYAMVRRRLNQSMKMTKQEVRDEYRLQEGDPLVRQQIRQRQREISRNRMIAAVADATVVIVNPTHVAVALRYVPGQGAPTVVAKGKGEVARRIREEAEKHRVPLVRDIGLAWTLHDSCTVDRTIPAELFEAVAKVLAFVLTVGRRTSGLGGIVSLNPA